MRPAKPTILLKLAHKKHDSAKLADQKPTIFGHGNRLINGLCCWLVLQIKNGQDTEIRIKDYIGNDWKLLFDLLRHSIICVKKVVHSVPLWRIWRKTEKPRPFACIFRAKFINFGQNWSLNFKKSQKRSWTYVTGARENYELEPDAFNHTKTNLMVFILLT